MGVVLLLGDEKPFHENGRIDTSFYSDLNTRSTRTRLSQRDSSIDYNEIFSPRVKMMTFIPCSELLQLKSFSKLTKFLPLDALSNVVSNGHVHIRRPFGPYL